MEFLFEDVKISAKRTTKRLYLETDENKKMESIRLVSRARQGYFLFQIYTDYYYKDLQIFKKEQLIDDEEFVASPGIEPGSGASETLILSIVLRGQGSANLYFMNQIRNS